MRAITFLKGLSLGAGLMYFYDPQLGRRRRKLAADQLQHALCELADTADVACRDSRNRLQGCIAECSSSLRPHDNSDRVVHDRVRSKLGRYVSHPGAVQVIVNEGHVALDGPVLACEVEPLIECLKSVHGVRSVDNRLEVHASAGTHPALQGGRPRTGQSLDVLQSNWSPATRCLVASLGGAMLVSSARSRGLMSLAKGAGAAWLFSCASAHQREQSRGGQHFRGGGSNLEGTSSTGGDASQQQQVDPAAADQAKSPKGQSFTSAKL